MMSKSFDLHEVQHKSKNVLISLGSLLSFYAVESAVLSLWPTSLTGTIFFVLALLLALDVAATVYNCSSLYQIVHGTPTVTERVCSWTAKIFTVCGWVCSVILPLFAMQEIHGALFHDCENALWIFLTGSALFAFLSYDDEELRHYLEDL